MKWINPLLVLLILHTSCKQEKSFQTTEYTAVAAGKCKTDSLNKFHYIRPAKQDQALPLLLILDSGGDGLMGINKIRPALTRIPCVVAGSDLVRNNFPGYERAINDLIDELCRNFAVSKDQVFIAGFSGGARMAFEYAQAHPVRGLLMCGAGPAGNSLRDLPCPVYMIGGTTDFNFSELYYNPLKKTGPQRYMADYFKGSHQWPPPESLQDGLLFLMNKSIPNGPELLQIESAILTEKTDRLLGKGEMLLAVKSLEKAVHFDLHNKRARREMQKLKNNRELTLDIAKIESDLALENRIAQEYSRASVEKDSLWWIKEIKQLLAEIEKSSGEDRDHYLRVKGFAGILFFSRLGTFIRSQPGNPQIEHLLRAYKMTEPENPDVFYYYALYAWKQGNAAESRQHLSRAVSLGFKDQERLRNDLPQLWDSFGKMEMSKN